MGRRLTPEEQETVANGLIALTCAVGTAKTGEVIASWHPPGARNDGTASASIFGANVIELPPDTPNSCRALLIPVQRSAAVPLIGVASAAAAMPAER